MSDQTRPLLLGSRAAGISERALRRRLEAATLQISVDPDLPGAWLTLGVLATTARRLPIRLALDAEGLPKEWVGDLRSRVERVDSSRGLILDPEPAQGVRLHIGTRAVSENVIRIVPDGYGAHVARDGHAVIEPARLAHPLGSVFAAAIGMGEAFKDLAGVLAARRVDHGHLTWCPVALSQDLTLAPMQAETLHLQLALAGCGAIGTAIAVILQELDAEGEVLVIDRQRFGTENLATYSLGDEGSKSGRPWKVTLVRRHLHRYKVQRYRGDVADLPRLVDEGRLEWPRVILAGLDTPEARRELQRLWPDRLIDGGTSDTAVGLHDVMAEDGPCIACFFPERKSKVLEQLADLTGLSLERLGQDDVIVPEDLEGKRAQQRAVLEPQVGGRVCGLAQAVGLVVDGEGGYQPAVTFVAQQAACHVVGRLIADEVGFESSGNFVEYDTLIGPREDCLDRRRANPACYCQSRGEMIRRVRAVRGARRLSHLGPAAGYGWPPEVRQ